MNLLLVLAPIAVDVLSSRPAESFVAHGHTPVTDICT
jgi:hypothetical protein